MKKEELRKIAIKLYNRGINTDQEIDFSPEMALAKYPDIEKCTNYVHEIFRIGKREYKRKYCIRN